MDKKIASITKYSDNKLQEYLNKEKLDVLHKMKIYADDLYYNLGEDTGFTDEQYDMLKETLQRRDKDYSVPIGTTLREGENRKELPFWLGSMNKFKPEDSEDIAKWLIKNKSSEYVIEDKLDGVSCLVIIKNNKIQLFTRGDGVIGADISYLSKYIKSIPKKVKSDISVRGELIIPIDVFNKKYAGKYKNPRNMVAGCTGAKKLKDGLQDIVFVAYEIVGNGTMERPTAQIAAMDYAGFTTVRYKMVEDITIPVLMETLIEFKDSSPYEIDGIIVQADEPYVRNVDGNPDYAFAFKMRLKENLIETEVVAVIWNISKWGQLKPRVEIKPVELRGVTITYATGFNAKYIVDNVIGPGAKIKITRSGDVIPYIVEVVKPSDSPEMPGIPYKWNKTGVDILAEEFGDTMCIKLITNFFHKLGIKQLGEKTIEKMYENGLDTILKIIKAPQERFEEVDGFAARGAERAYENIHEGLQNLSLPIVLGASGIFGFGLGRKRVSNLFNEMPNLLTDYKKMSKKELYTRIMEIDGFSDITTKSIVNNIKWADKFINELKKHGKFKKKQKVDNSLEGMIIVFTGKRDTKLMSDIEARGGKITGTVSKNTSVLIIADGGERQGKALKAEALGIPILERSQFIRQYIK
jgi:NAD-dependent DNA ligase